MIDRIKDHGVGAVGRFVLVGGFIGFVNLATMTVLTQVIDAPAQPALVVAYGLVVVLQFSLNRSFVFAADNHALGLSQQGVRYLLFAAFVYSVTAGAMALLPGWTGVDQFVVYLAVTVALAAVSFVFMLTKVFHRAPEHGEQP